MKLIIGLGNPGSKYEATRHNVGFFVVDELSKCWGIPMTKQKWNGLVGEGIYQKEKIILIKPQTYMNLSGESVREACQFLKVDMKDIVVIYDDLDLPCGKIRLRLKGGSGGHNGIKSLIHCLGQAEFNRIRIGIGRPPEYFSVADYVLSSFSKEEGSIIQSAVEKAAKAVESWITVGFVDTMNHFNA